MPCISRRVLTVGEKEYKALVREEIQGLKYLSDWGDVSVIRAGFPSSQHDLSDPKVDQSKEEGLSREAGR